MAIVPYKGITEDEVKLKPYKGRLEGESPTISGEFTKGISSGIDSLQGSLYGAGAAAANKVGATGARDWLEQGMQRNAREAQDNAPEVQSYKDVNDIGDAAMYAAGGLGQLVPFMGQSIVAGLGSRYLGKKLGINPNIAGQTGALVSNTATEAGSIYGDILEKTGQRDSDKALGYGIAAGALDTLGESSLLSKLDGVSPGALIKRVPEALVKQGAKEAATEGMQTAIERAAVTDVDQTQKTFSPEGREEIANAMIIGGIGGGVAGGLSEAIAPQRQEYLPPDDNPPPPPAGDGTLPQDQPPVNPVSLVNDVPVEPVAPVPSIAADMPPSFVGAAEDFTRAKNHVEQKVEQKVAEAASVDPNNGVLSRVVSMGAQNGAIAEKAAEEATAEIAAVQEKPTAKSKVAEVDVSAPISEYSDEDLVGLIKAQLSSGNKVSSAQVAKATGVDPARAAAARETARLQIEAERNPDIFTQPPVVQPDPVPESVIKEVESKSYPSFPAANIALINNGLKGTHRPWADGKGGYIIKSIEDIDNESQKLQSQQQNSAEASDTGIQDGSQKPENDQGQETENAAGNVQVADDVKSDKGYDPYSADAVRNDMFRSADAASSAKEMVTTQPAPVIEQAKEAPVAVSEAPQINQDQSSDLIEIVSEKGMRVDLPIEKIQAILGDKVKVPAHKKGGFLMSRKYEQKLRDALSQPETEKAAEAPQPEAAVSQEKTETNAAPVRGVVVNRLGADGLTDEERAAGKTPYTGSASERNWKRANPNMSKGAAASVFEVGQPVRVNNEEGVVAKSQDGDRDSLRVVMPDGNAKLVDGRAVEYDSDWNAQANDITEPRVTRRFVPQSEPDKHPFVARAFLTDDKGAAVTPIEGQGRTKEEALTDLKNDAKNKRKPNEQKALAGESVEESSKTSSKSSKDLLDELKSAHLETVNKLREQDYAQDDRLLSKERMLAKAIKEAEVAEGQNDELDAEMRSYESKAEQAVLESKPGSSILSIPDKELAKAKSRAAKAKREAEKINENPKSLGEKVAAQKKVKDADADLRKARQNIFDVEDAVNASLDAGNLDAFTPELQSVFPDTYKAVRDSIEQSSQVEKADETPKLDQPSEGALGGAPAEPVQGAQGERESGRGAGRSRRADGIRNKRSDEPGNGLESSVGDDKGEVSVPAGRGKRGRGGDAGQRDIFSAEPVAPHEGQSVAAHASDPVFDYRITEDTALGEGGKKTKYKGNIAAIKLLRDLEESGRHATPEEQNVLARYVGWGGIHEAFDTKYDQSHPHYDSKDKDWVKEFAELRELLDDEEYETARQSTQYAHYTSKEIIGGIYDAVKHIGFNGGKILEPGMGVGNFLGLMPDDLRGNSRFTGVERERIAGGIAKNLYPNHSIQQADFTEWVGQKGYFDLAIGNPPFAATTLKDKAGDKHLSGLSIHNYFFAKSVDQLREGGVLAMVVTNSFMDAKRDTARKYIADRTTLLGAIRLPNNAFSKNAMTEVTTDIIFLQKLPEAKWGNKETTAAAQAWLDIGSMKDADTGKPIPINQYFIDHPEMLLGEMTLKGTQWKPDSPALVARAGQNTADLMDKAIKNLPKGVYASVETLTEAYSDKLLERMSNIDVEVGGFFMRDGDLYQREEDVAGEQIAEKLTPNSKWTEKKTLGIKQYNQLKSLYELRTNLKQLIAAEINGDATAMEALRKSLNAVYDDYTQKYGLINSAATVNLYSEDPDFPLLSSLEHGYDKGISDHEAKKTGVKKVAPSAKKAPIFSRAVVDARKPVSSAKTPLDALLVSLAERGTIDVGYVGELLKTDGHEALKSLTEGDNPELFVDPATGGYSLRDEYLSGNVRKKLKEAIERRSEKHIEALEKVLPKDKEPGQISGNIGAPWIAESIYEDFAHHLFGGKASVNYSAVAGSFSADFSPDNDVANNNTFGIPEYPASKIIEALLNHRVIRVGHYDSEGKFHLDSEKTQAANDKAREIKDAFQDWMFADSDRTEKLVRDFNDANNNYVKRQFDGKLLTYPGKVPDSIIRMRRHQSNAIWRIIQDRTALLDHVVGAGKTFTVVAAAMELKRMGLARKPMVAVPNHLVKQWAADFYRLYPGANILAITKKDFAKANRRKFTAKIATGDWDAVIISHSSFGFIKPDAEFETNFLNDEINGILEAIEEAKRDEGKKATVKQLEKMREKLQNRVATLRDKPMDDLLDFAQIGVDQLFVDEAHLFKNLMFSTKMQNVRGLGDPKGSQRALDLFIKAQQLYNKNGNGQGVVFATGTPVSNSLAEMYHMMRYLQPQELKDAGLWNFDAWADTFAETDQVWMQSPSGSGYKSSNRMVKFVNANSLLQIFNQIADTVTMDDIKGAYKEETGQDFPIPRLKGGKRQAVSIALSPEQKEYMGEIEKRAQKVEERKGPPKKGEDNILSIMSDARKMAMDIRLVNHDINDRPADGRIAIAGQNIFDRYKQYDKVKGTQLVFSDMSTPLKSAAKELKEYEKLKERMAPLDDEDLQARAALGDEKAIEAIEDAENAAEALDAKGRDWLDGIKAALRGFSVYDDMKALLVEKGIPAKEIAFIHDYNTDDQKAALYSAMNSGRIRVLLGSTPKLGAGTNVQERLVALHHLDVPWRPSDVEQREGRIIRQGNIFSTPPTADRPNPLYDAEFEVEVLAYATQDTLDLFMWQTQEKKLNMIGQLRTGSMGDEIENVFEDMSMSAGEMQAAATSNPYMMQEIQLKDLVKRLERKQRSFQAQQSSLVATIKRAEKDVASAPEEIQKYKELQVANDKYLDAIGAQQSTFSVSINGKQYDNVKEAQATLLSLTETEKGQRMEPVEMNGETYTSKATVAEALQEIIGDRDPILFSIGKKQYIRRKHIEAAIKNKVADAVESGELVSLGKFGDIELSVDATENRYSKGDYYLGIHLKSGDAEHVGEVRVNGEAVKRAEDFVIRQAEKELDSFGYLKRKAQEKQEKAVKTLENAKKAGGGEFAQANELEEARAKHKEVLGLLKETGKEVKEADDEGAKFRRGGVDAAGMKPVQVRAIVNNIAAKWKNAPQIVVANSVAELPFKAPADAAGAFHNGKVYLVAGNLRNRDHAEFVLLHEALGHYGLAGALGNSLKPSMRAMYRQNKNVRDLADKYLAENDGASIDLAVEEALSDIAGAKLQKLKGIDKLIAAIKNAIRAMGFNLQLSDNDVLYMMGKAREFVEKGTTVTGNQESARFMSGFHEEAPNDISPIGFYSPLARAARNLVQQKGTPEQMLAMLERQKGVKPAEIEATGLKEYLQLQGKSVTKQQIVDYLSSNGVQVQESMLGAGKEPKLPDGWTVKYDREEDAWIVYDQDGDEMADGTSREDAIEMAMDDDVRADNADMAGETKFGQYVLPGGKNYRELLLALPRKTHGKYWIEETTEVPGYPKYEIASKRESDGETVYHGRSFGKRTHAEEAVEKMEGEGINFNSSHYDQPNILAHVRFNERTDADGKRVLFLEELQSDFQQSYRKAKKQVAEAVDADFLGIVERMKRAGVLEVNCD